MKRVLSLLAFAAVVLFVNVYIWRTHIFPSLSIDARFAACQNAIGRDGGNSASVVLRSVSRPDDATGYPVRAHAGGVLKVDGYYYWVGQKWLWPTTDISIYRSTNLRDWEYRNDIITEKSSPELRSKHLERPKIIFNKNTGKYVLWMHKDDYNYKEARVAVAISDNIDGNYTYLGSFRPADNESRDMTVYRDDDESGYLVSAAHDNSETVIYRLSNDYTRVDSIVAKLWSGQLREAYTLFKRNGVYFMTTSGATGWNPNQQKFATAPNIAGPWTSLRDFADSNSCRSQGSFVTRIEGSRGAAYLYMADIWNTKALSESKFFVTPLSFPDDRTLAMDCTDFFVLNPIEGTTTTSCALADGK